MHEHGAAVLGVAASRDQALMLHVVDQPGDPESRGLDRTCALGARNDQTSTLVAEQSLHDLDDAWIIATDETPIPYSPTLEDAYLPDTDAIVTGVRSRAGVGTGR